MKFVESFNGTQSKQSYTYARLMTSLDNILPHDVIVTWCLLFQHAGALARAASPVKTGIPCPSRPSLRQT